MPVDGADVAAVGRPRGQASGFVNVRTTERLPARAGSVGVYELSGGSVPQARFVAFALNENRSCTITLMTAGWPVHRND